MYFTNYAYGNLRVEKSEKLYTGTNPKTSLVWKDLNGASVKGDDGTGFLLLFNQGQDLFIVTHKGYVYTGIFEKIDEEGNLVLEDKFSIDPKNIVFIGEGKRN